MAIRRSRINKRALLDARRRKAVRGITVSSFKNFDEEDIVESDVAKAITSALWSNNASTLTTQYVSSAQTSSAVGAYQYEVYAENPASNDAATVQYNIAFGHSDGSGSVTASGASSADKTPSKAVYTAFANQLLAAGDDLFTINDIDAKAMIFICVQRDRFKEKVNPNGWELHIKNGSSEGLKLIDDSAQQPEGSVNGNRVYNIVSGTLAAGPKAGIGNLGLFYPDLGILAINHSASTALGDNSILGSATYPSNASVDYVDKIWNAINAATYGRNFQGRAEEDISSTHYFVRVKNSEYNYSNNPTFSNTVGQLQNSSMVGDPTSYITTVGLYNDENELVATAKLSKPLAKTFAREATIRVKLDY